MKYITRISVARQRLQEGEEEAIPYIVIVDQL